jgi:hypothetical protein
VDCGVHTFLRIDCKSLNKVSFSDPHNLVGGPRYVAIFICGLRYMIIAFLEKGLEALWSFSHTPLSYEVLLCNGVCYISKV